MSKIILYTRTNCPYCELVKKFLDMKGVAYTTVSMEKSREVLDTIMAMTGRTIAPTTVIEKADGTQEAVVGFNLGGIASAIG